MVDSKSATMAMTVWVSTNTYQLELSNEDISHSKKSQLYNFIKTLVHYIVTIRWLWIFAVSWKVVVVPIWAKESKGIVAFDCKC